MVSSRSSTTFCPCLFVLIRISDSVYWSAASQSAKALCFCFLAHTDERLDGCLYPSEAESNENRPNHKSGSRDTCLHFRRKGGRKKDCGSNCVDAAGVQETLISQLKWVRAQSRRISTNHVNIWRDRYRPNTPSTRTDVGNGRMFTNTVNAKFTVVAVDFPSPIAPGTKSVGLFWR
jgi:hypothetical protein